MSNDSIAAQFDDQLGTMGHVVGVGGVELIGSADPANDHALIASIQPAVQHCLSGCCVLWMNFNGKCGMHILVPRDDGETVGVHPGVDQFAISSAPGCSAVQGIVIGAPFIPDVRCVEVVQHQRVGLGGFLERQNQREAVDAAIGRATEWDVVKANDGLCIGVEWRNAQCLIIEISFAVKDATVHLEGVEILCSRVATQIVFEHDPIARRLSMYCRGYRTEQSEHQQGSDALGEQEVRFHGHLDAIKSLGIQRLQDLLT